MTAADKQLVKQVLALSEKDRARLVGRLIKSLNQDGTEKPSAEQWDKAWEVEVKKRLRELRSGKVKAMPGAQVIAELKAKYG